jgi:hypothetical protein
MATPVSLVLLRALLPDMPLRPGALLSARVLDPKTIVLEGVRMPAKLPEGVQPGQRLALQVVEASPERLHLQVVERAAPDDAPAAAAAVPAAAYAVALPGGVAVQLYVEEREEGGGGRGARGAAASVVVRYDSPTLGRLDVRLDGASAAIHVPAGEPAERVREAAGRLAEALARAAGGQPVQVTVHPRIETYDARA